MFKANKEKRNHYRIQVKLPVICESSGELKIATSGTSFDLSDSGMCFYTHMRLREGINLQLQIPHIWDVSRTSIVRWCSMKNPNLYKIGVLFQ